MEKTYASLKTPGQLISLLLEERAWTKRLLATILNRSETTMNKIIADKMPISAELAIELEEIFNVPAEEFLRLQNDYNIAKARITAIPNPERVMRAELLSKYPITEMINRGWLEVNDKKDIIQIEQAIAKFFNVESVSDISSIPHAAKKTGYFSPPSPIQLAWVHRVKTIAKDLIVAKFNDSSAKVAADKLSNLLLSSQEIRKVPRILAEHGIRFVIVESLKSAKIDGVCLWLNANSPVIGMSLRYDRIDNFWFVLRHELEHVIRRHGMDQPCIDIELDGKGATRDMDLPEEEKIANIAAEQFCVDPKKMEGFIARKGPFFRESDILAFSKTNGVHPGLVAGQLQYQTGKYHLFRTHLEKIKSIIAPNAAVDGWGDTYCLD